MREEIFMRSVSAVLATGQKTPDAILLRLWEDAGRAAEIAAGRPLEKKSRADQPAARQPPPVIQGSSPKLLPNGNEDAPMRIRLAVPDRFITPEMLDAALEASTRGQEQMIAAGASPTTPELLNQGVRWKPEPFSDGEHFDTGDEALRRGWADCDDLAPNWAATLRATGADPGARARVYRSGPKTWHVVVQRSNGAIDDPSVWAGMKRHKGIRGATQGTLVSGEPVLATRRWRKAWAARCDLPWVNGHGCALSGNSIGTTELDAITGAIAAASTVGLAAGVVDPDTVARLYALQSLSAGASEDDVRRALLEAGYGHVAGDTLQSIGFGVGSLFDDVVNVAKGAAHAAAPIASMVPGVGPLAGGVLNAFGGGGGAPAPAAGAPGAPGASWGAAPGGGYGHAGPGSYGQPTVVTPQTPGAPIIIARF